MPYRTRDLPVRQRTRTIDALRGHLAEHGVVAPTGIPHVGRLEALIEGDERTLPARVVTPARTPPSRIAALTERIDGPDEAVRQREKEEAAVKRLMTTPGVGPIAATALTTFAPPPETFAKGRDVEACLGLTPRQHAPGSRERLGRTTREGQRDIRRLLITGCGRPRPIVSHGVV